MSSHIQLVSGGLFNPLDPDPELIRIEDIAHALAHICRFGGHSKQTYSVAEHSVHVSRACAPTDALWGLLHDAPEGLGLGDVASPLKHAPEFGQQFRMAEERLMGAVIERFRLGPLQPLSVSNADKAMLEVERRTLLNSSPEAEAYWAEWAERLGGIDTEWLPEMCRPHCWHPELAKMFFLERFAELTNGR